MRYAHHGHTRIEAQPSVRAECQLCETELYAACGEIQRWHWRHVNKKDCDPWYSYKSDWHIDWQNKFPESWREVVINKNGVKHIADIQTLKKIVIEFQHSSISTYQIRERESFYQNMLWVINAQEFKDNFRIRSNVNSKLRNLEQEKRYEETVIQDELDDEIKSKKTQIKDLERTIKDNQYKIEQLKDQKDKYRSTLIDIDNFVQNEIIENWAKLHGFWDYNFNDFLRPLEVELKLQTHDITIEIQKSKQLIKEKKNLLDSINELLDTEIEGKQFKLVNYNQLNSKNYHKSIVINKVTLNTFFPEITKFNSEQDFLRYKYLQDKFEFAIDPEETIDQLRNELFNIDKNLQSQTKKLTSIKSKLIDTLSKSIQLELNELNKKEVVLKKANLGQTELYELKKKNLLEIENSKSLKIKKEIQKLEKEYKQHEIEIKITNKGRYTYSWKHERKTWRAANCLILFDVGEDYLFERTADGHFKKVFITDFLKEHLNEKINTTGNKL